ncbi:MAG TPA: response regulator [Candidatus Aminicenantes bacterium]|nr:response regulator [Acidobacteriota bacterium]HOS10363.1 response regulator [Candidatus Aminicenantes bacterium]HOU47895.1 response regulator [Candidatus Aminicenantes bacterium]HPL13181.1 response regulator [Candidatus Aminicenantes bacterium]HQH44776.1 response regulator [Candidatus Aminicenantes bacterium]
MSMKILLADASPVVRKAVETALPGAEFEVRTAPDGLAAIRILPEFFPDAVLVALSLPGMDGYDVAAFLCSQPVYRTTALFLLPGAFEAVDVAKLSVIRHDGLIRKPFDGETLLSRIRTAIDRKKELPSLPEDPFLDPQSLPETASVASGPVTPDSGNLPEWTDDVERKIRDVIRQEILRNQAEMEERARDIVSAEFKKVLVEELKAVDGKR